MPKSSAFEDTLDIPIPKDPFERIIGQDEAVRIARMVPYQRRHLLLVGPPGTGKSMIAQAISSVLPVPHFEVSILDNPEVPERPIVEIRDEGRIRKDEGDKNEEKKVGTEVHPLDTPSFVAERLGFRCRRCAALSSFTDVICPQCGANKAQNGNLFERYDMPQMQQEERRTRVTATRRLPNGRDEVLIYERGVDGRITLFTPEEMKKVEELRKKYEQKSRRKVIIPLKRTTFVQASGGTETELLGDIRHDPYHGHKDPVRGDLGTPAYKRVVPGALHEAHEGVLFIDELSTLGNIQRYILTAMQERAFAIVGRNPQSSGASVRVDGVPCDFIFVGASNINDIRQIIPSLRSRIRGDGYEVLMNAYMDDTKANEAKLAQFIAQEITKDGKIPHAEYAAAMLVIEEARNIARKVDNAKGLTLRLRNLTGILKMAGDIATMEKKELIEEKDVRQTIRESKSIEEKLRERYGNWWSTEAADHGMKNEKAGPETA
jgi:ATP-dependent Lon protease